MASRTLLFPFTWARLWEVAAEVDEMGWELEGAVEAAEEDAIPPGWVNPCLSDTS